MTPLIPSAVTAAVSKEDRATLSSCDDERDSDVRPILDRVKQFIQEHGHNASGAKQASLPVVSNNGPSRASAPVFNPISEWEEPTEIPHLTLFELYRRPRPIIRDTKKRIQLPIKTLHAEFCCPICLGYIRRTSIVMECLHRFCAECIEKCLRLGKKQCPSCRVHIPSRRALRSDPNFDKLIGKIYGDITALEQKEETEIKIYNEARNINNAYAESRRKGMLHQAIQRKKKPQGGRPSIESRTEAAVEEVHPRTVIPSLPPTSVEFMQESPLVNFVLRKDPRDNVLSRLDKEYLRTNINLSIQHLKNFLSRKLMCKDATTSDIQIYILSGEKQEVILDNSRTLGEVQGELWNLSDDEMILYYRIQNQSNFSK